MQIEVDEPKLEMDGQERDGMLRMSIMKRENWKESKRRS